MGRCVCYAEILLFFVLKGTVDMNNNNESNIRIRDLFLLFMSNLWIMILVAAIVAVSAFSFKFVTYKPLYESTGSMFILRQGESMEEIDYSSNFNVALSVVNDCKKLLTSHTVIDAVIEENNLTYTYSQLNSMITITNPSNTRYLEITVLSKSPEESKLIVDSICEIGEKAIDDLMGFDQVNKFDEGTLAQHPSNTKYQFTFAFLVGLAAFLLTYVVIAMLFVFDDRISDPEVVEKQLGLSVLAIIPNVDIEKTQAMSTKPGKYASRRRYYPNNRKENK